MPALSQREFSQQEFSFRSALIGNRHERKMNPIEHRSDKDGTLQRKNLLKFVIQNFANHDLEALSCLGRSSTKISNSFSSGDTASPHQRKIMKQIVSYSIAKLFSVGEV